MRVYTTSKECLAKIMCLVLSVDTLSDKEKLERIRDLLDNCEDF